MNKLTILKIAILVTLILVFFGITVYQNSFQPKSSPSISEAYWDEMALVNYLVSTYLPNIHQSGGGNGEVHWSEGEKDFLIKCETNYPYEHTFKECCKEGEVSWEQKYDSDTITWINITRDTCQT